MTLDGAVAAGLFDVADAQTLKDCYDLCWSVQSAARLLSGKVLETDQIGEGGSAFMCRATGFEQIGYLRDALQESYTKAAALIAAVFEEGQDGAQ